MVMQNLKYHMMNIASVIIFSYITASTINHVIKYNMTPSYTPVIKKELKTARKKAVKSLEDYNPIIESGFFKISDSSGLSTVESSAPSAGSLDSLTLLGTITGPSSIARALVRKAGEKEPQIFALYKINSEINNDVYGYKLIKIGTDRVHLDLNGQRSVLELYGKKETPQQHQSTAQPDTSGNLVKKNISRAEIKQKVMNDLDNAMKGLLAGPYRENGAIVGYQLKKVRPYNILYKLGARSGDIVKRVNGKTIDSTDKLYKMWQSLQNENKITVDIERGGRLVTFDLNITE